MDRSESNKTSGKNREIRNLREDVRIGCVITHAWKPGQNETWQASQTWVCARMSVWKFRDSEVRVESNLREA